MKTVGCVLFLALCACVDMYRLNENEAFDENSLRAIATQEELVNALRSIEGQLVDNDEVEDDVKEQEELANALRSIEGQRSDKNEVDDELEALGELVRTLSDDETDAARKMQYEVDPEEISRRQIVSQGGFDQTLDFRCNHGSSINFITSEHSNRHEDRRWTMSCAPTGVSGQSYCSRTQFINDWDSVMNFNCPHDGYIAGVLSIHNNGKQDRRWKLDCCFVPGRCMRHCTESHLNDWDGHLFYQTPGGKLLRGLYSVHNNGNSDRRYKFRSCSYVAC